MLAWRRSAPRHPSLGPVALSAAEIISTGAVGLPFSAWASSFPHRTCFAWSFREATILTNCRRVEERRSSRVELVAVAHSFRHSRCLSLHLDHVSSPRSSNPACGFPALGSRVGSRAARSASRCRPRGVSGPLQSGVADALGTRLPEHGRVACKRSCGENCRETAAPVVRRPRAAPPALLRL